MGMIYPSDDSEACRCGRLNNKIHCPQCGNYTVYGFASKRDIVTDKFTGESKQVPVFRCRRCSLVFNDIEWREHCSALQVQQPKDTTGSRLLAKLANSGVDVLGSSQTMSRADLAQRIAEVQEQQLADAVEEAEHPAMKMFDATIKAIKEEIKS